MAKEKERAIERAEILVSVRDLKGQTVGDLLNRYEEEAIPFKRGSDREHFKLRVIRRHAIAEADLSKLTALSVSQFRDERLKVVTTGTVRRELAILRHCLEVARKEWGAPSLPTQLPQFASPLPAKPERSALARRSLEPSGRRWNGQERGVFHPVSAWLTSEIPKRANNVTESPLSRRNHRIHLTSHI
ncbi:hypothetical protein [Microvirga sp. CF3016]|uniref:hypothetical protein n=1 Tax=Microvirga sp. CF3016 TaxID=3110181 RepID=UPI002E794494|nr:hypothetical protein [Microvirga sp. CF3016]MEE1614006.1 hypothetical protein [Microvirga sp. CF3016]